MASGTFEGKHGGGRWTLRSLSTNTTPMALLLTFHWAQLFRWLPPPRRGGWGKGRSTFIFGELSPAIF